MAIPTQNSKKTKKLLFFQKKQKKCSFFKKNKKSAVFSKKNKKSAVFFKILQKTVNYTQNTLKMIKISLKNAKNEQQKVTK